MWFLEGDREWIAKSLCSCPLHFLLHLTDISTLLEQIVVKVSSFSRLLTIANVTIAFIIHDYMISDSFSTLNIGCGCVCIWLMLSLVMFKIFSCTSPLQSYAFRTTRCIQYCTTNLIIDDCCAGYEKYLHCCHYTEQSQWFWAHVSLTQVLPFCCMSGILWCENIAPCWFPFVLYQRRPQTMLTDRRHVGWSCSDVTERLLLDLTTFLWFRPLSCRESGVIFLGVSSAAANVSCLEYAADLCGLHKPKQLEKSHKTKSEWSK